jgi:hypothetical protein
MGVGATAEPSSIESADLERLVEGVARTPRCAIFPGASTGFDTKMTRTQISLSYQCISTDSSAQIAAEGST